MPIILVALGVILIVAAIRNTIGALATQLDKDLTASQGGVSFLTWVAAIVAIGLVGYIPGLKIFSRAFLALVVLVVVLKSKGGLYSGLLAQLKAPPPQIAGDPNPAPANLPDPTINIKLADGKGGGAGGAAGDIAGKAAGAILGGLF